MSKARKLRPGRKRGTCTQIARVFDLVEKLRGGGAVHVADTAERFDVSKRQVQRDLEAIRTQLDLPLRRPEDADAGWMLDREASRTSRLRAVRATVLSIAIGAKLSLPLWGDRTRRDLLNRVDTLIADLGQTDERRLKNWSQRVAVVTPGQKDYASQPQLAATLDCVIEAMSCCRPLRLSYLSHHRALQGCAPRRLRVHPLGLIHYCDGVYFIVDVVGDGGDSDHTDKRILLALDRIRDVTRVGNHLLAIALRDQPSSLHATAKSAVVYHPGDQHCTDVVADYQRLLAPDEDSFVAWTLDHVVEAFESAACSDERHWLASFRARYLDLATSEVAWRSRRFGQ